MPLTSRGSPVFIAGRGLTPVPMAKLSIPFNQPVRYTISGVTKDSTGAALADCQVNVFVTQTRALYADTVSDANGIYRVDVTGAPDLTFYVVAYKTGAPDVAGTTVNTLVGANA